MSRLRDVLRHPPARLGRRGAVLLIIGLIWVVRGVGVLTTPQRTPPPPLLLHEEIAPVVLGCLWVGCGLVGMVVAFAHHPDRDGPGFGALVAPPILHTISYGWAWLVSLVGPDGSPRGWQSAVVWAAVTVLIVTISGWAETPRGLTRPVEPDEGPW